MKQSAAAVAREQARRRKLLARLTPQQAITAITQHLRVSEGVTLGSCYAMRWRVYEFRRLSKPIRQPPPSDAEAARRFAPLVRQLLTSASIF